MHEWKKHAWNEATWQWLKPYLGSDARENTMLRDGNPSEKTVPLRDILWRYTTGELSLGEGELPFSAVMSPQFAARAILEAQGLDDSAEAADEALSTPEGVTDLFQKAKARRWSVMAYCFLPVGGEVLSEIITWLTADLEGKYSRSQARIDLNLLGSNRTLSGRDLELVDEAIALIPKEPTARVGLYGKPSPGCSYEECPNHFAMVNDGTRKLESVRGARQNLFSTSLHCENCDPPVWNLTRYGILLDEILASETRQMDARYSAIARILLPFMGYRFAYMDETFTRDTPGEWLVELLSPSEDEAVEERDVFMSALRRKYSIPESDRRELHISDMGSLSSARVGNIAATNIVQIPNPVAPPFNASPNWGII